MLTIAAATSIASADFVIDDFSDVQEPSQWPVVRNTLGTTNITESGLIGVLGGVRESSITADFLSTPGLDNATVTAAPTPAGVLDFASTSGAEGSLGLRYDGNGSLTADLSSEISINLEFLFFDLANTDPLTIEVTITDGGGDSRSGSATLIVDGPQTVSLFIAAFVENGLGTTELTDIRSIDFDFDGALATDFRIDYIVTVPTPAVLPALGFGLLAMRRRRRGG